MNRQGEKTFSRVKSESGKKIHLAGGINGSTRAKDGLARFRGRKKKAKHYDKDTSG